MTNMKELDIEFRRRQYLMKLPVIYDNNNNIELVPTNIELIKHSPHFYINFEPVHDTVKCHKIDLNTMLAEDPELWNGFRVIEDEMINNVNIRIQLAMPHPRQMHNIKLVFTEMILVDSIYQKNDRERGDGKLTLYFLTDKRTIPFKYNFLIAEYRYATTVPLVTVLTKAFVLEYRESDIIHLTDIYNIKAEDNVLLDDDELEMVHNDDDT